MEFHLLYDRKIYIFEKIAHVICSVKTQDWQASTSRYFPNEPEWDILKKIMNMLKVYKNATEAISTGSVSLSMVFPLFIIVFSSLERDIQLYKDTDAKFSQALDGAHSLLSKYYEKSKSPFYVASVLLDHHFKLQFLQS